MPTIKITDDRQGRSFRTGVNGRFYDYPLNVEQEVDDEMLAHLTGLGVALEEVSSKGTASKEGSDGAVPIGEHAVIAPAMAPRSLNERPLMGDQPGDLTGSGGVRFSSVGAGPSIKDDAEVSDIRVAAERSAPKDASVAEVAGEGESGTHKTAAPSAALNKQPEGDKAEKQPVANKAAKK